MSIDRLIAEDREGDGHVVAYQQDRGYYVEVWVRGNHVYHAAWMTEISAIVDFEKWVELLEAQREREHARA